MLKMYRQLPLVMLLLLTANGQALAASLLVSPHVYHYQLNSYVEYLEDPDGTLEIEDILLDYKDSSTWIQNDESVPNLGFTKSVYWFRINIVNPTEYPFVRLLEIAYPLMDSVSMYQYEDDELMANFIAGNKIVFRSRPIKHRHLVFPVEVTAEKQSQIYLRVESGNGIQVPMHLWEERVFWTQDQSKLAWQFLYYGLMAVMIVYNLFLAWGVRDSSYLFYVLTMTSVAGFQAILHGSAFQFIWPQLPEWNAMSMAVFIPISNAVAGIFSIQMLRVKEKTPLLFQVLRVSIGVSFLLALLGLVLPYKFVVPAAALFVIVSSTVVCIACLKRWPDKERDARIFTIAWFTFVAGCVTMALNKFSLLPYNWFTENLMQIGSGIETVLLSLALAERINRLREDKVNLQKSQLDVREREMLSEKELLEAKYESKAKSDFLAVMSHEIRTPMNGVLGVVDLLKETPLNKQQNQLLATIQSSGKLLLNIINDILDFSKIEAGKLELESIPLNLEQVIGDSVAIYAPNASQKKLTLAFYIDPEISPAIKGDPTRIKQVIYNLLGNAIKFTDRGHVFIKVSLLTTTDSQQRLRFEVMDSGIGMSEEQQAKLFDSFTQADKSTSRKFGGTGLGLAISKKLVEAMEGKIGVHSHSGEGSNFWVEISLENTAPAVTPPKDKKQLLVCSDYLPLIDFVASGLNSKFYSVQPVILSGFQTHIPQFNISFDQALVFVEKNPTIEPKVCSYLTENNQLEHGKIIVFNHENRNDQLSLSNLSVVDSPFNINAILNNKVTSSIGVEESSENKDNASNSANKLDLRILVVEDNPVNQMVIKGMLKPLVGDVDVANNGREAVDRFVGSLEEYDLIFMDCEMPEMDGYEATTKIRELESQAGKQRSVKIVALTAHAFEEFKQKAFAVGMDAHLTKPINRSTLTHFFENEFVDLNEAIN
ncbi:MAG: ATP-binding protein [Pseudomonadales bacterium]|nr:ATP-binding protein [Pseudomonadales bacterium]